MKQMFIVAAAGAAALAVTGNDMSLSAQTARDNVDAQITRHAQAMLEEGKKIFRYDTFGSEAFWGDALQLHKAIAGEKNGGVGAGVSPKTALSVVLNVDGEELRS